MSEKLKCKWEHTRDGEMVTGCRNEFYFDGVDIEGRVDMLLYTYCPYCGKKIQFEAEQKGE